MRTDERKWLTIAAFAIVYVVWGSTYLAIRIGVQSLPPMLMAGSRFLIAGTLLSGCALARGASLPTLSQWRSAAIAGTLLLVMGNGGVTWAEQYVPSGVASLLVASEPFFLVLLSWGFFGGSRPSVRTTTGLVVGLIGVAALVLPGGHVSEVGHQSRVLAGSLAILFAAFAWAVGSLYLRRADLPSSPVLGTGIQMLSGGSLMVAFGLIRGEARSFDPAAITAESAMAWFYLIIFGSLLGFTAYGWLTRMTTPTKLSTYAYVNPVVAVLLGHVVLRERIAPIGWAAMLIILASVALVTTGETVPAEPNESDEAVEPAPLALPAALGEQV